jgi:hypothetical protein
MLGRRRVDPVILLLLLKVASILLYINYHPVGLKTAGMLFIGCS